MASMDDLIATISGGLHAGQQGNDLKDLHAKLAQTLNNPLPQPHYRPIPPTTSTPHSAGPLPPPAPVSSWNTPPPNSFLFSSSPHAKSVNKGFNSGSACGVSPSSGNREAGFAVIQEQDERFSNFSNSQSQSQFQSNTQGQAQGQRQKQGQGEERPYHASVLPVKASPKDTGGFTDDAFKPLWDERERDQWNGFKHKGA